MKRYRVRVPGRGFYSVEAERLSVEGRAACFWVDDEIVQLYAIESNEFGVLQVERMPDLDQIGST